MKLNKPYIGAASFLLEFVEPVKTVRFEQGRAEDAFSQIAGTQSQQTNVPDSLTPNVARIIFPGAKKVISISQAGLQIEFHFEAGGLKEQMAIVEKNASAFYRAAVEKFAIGKYGTSALIVSVQYPSEDDVESLHGFIREHFFKHADIGLTPASAQLALGFRQDDFFINLAVDAYEKRQVKFENVKPGETLFLRQQDAEVVEAGLGFRIDVNNRPAVLAGTQDRTSFDSLLKVMRNFAENAFPKLTGLTLS